MPRVYELIRTKKIQPVGDRGSWRFSVSDLTRAKAAHLNGKNGHSGA